MFKTIAMCSVLLFSMGAPVLAQTPAHRAATGVMHPTAPAASSSSLAAGQFSTEAAAKAHCPSDTVVWANLSGSKAYHMAGNKYFGKTKHGAYMCQKQADEAGFHAAGRRAAKTSAHTKTTK